ncbi:MAG: hypothetical protein WCF82_26645 [Microcoleus sp.]
MFNLFKQSGSGDLALTRDLLKSPKINDNQASEIRLMRSQLEL